jgi:hypothetical protein
MEVVTIELDHCYRRWAVPNAVLLVVFAVTIVVLYRHNEAQRGGGIAKDKFDAVSLDGALLIHQPAQERLGILDRD